MDKKFDEGSSKLLLRRAFAALVFQSDGAILKVVDLLLLFVGTTLQL
jgi:hypothetical protein